jgi:3D (Asp-Asp-Asp) domain-containing protein
MRFTAGAPLNIADISVVSLGIDVPGIETARFSSTLQTEIAPDPVARPKPSESAASALPDFLSFQSAAPASNRGTNANGYVNLDGTTRSDIATPPEFTAAQAQLFKVTFYCACLECCGKTNAITASGTPAQAGVTIAASSAIPFGTRMWIEDYGERVVHDRGGAITTNRIDVYVNTHAEALRHGVRTKQVWFL